MSDVENKLIYEDQPGDVESLGLIQNSEKTSGLSQKEVRYCLVNFID